MEERPTRHVYIEILRPATIGPKRRQNGAWPRAPALGTRAPALQWCPIRVYFGDYAPLTLRIEENHAIKVGLIGWWRIT